MMIERLNGRPSIALAAAALLLVLIVGWFGFVSPQRSKAASLERTISDTERQLAVTEAVARGSGLAQSARELSVLRTAVPDETSMPQIIRQLTRASADGNVRITGVTPGAVVANGIANTIPLTLTIEGTYFGIREFLRHLRTRAEVRGEKLRASGRLFSVESIQFTKSSTGNATRLEATVLLSAYSFSAQAPTPGAAATVPSEPGTEASGG